MNYKNDIRIDPNNLDIEWLRQPDLAYIYGNELAEARSKTDRAKERMDIESANAFKRALETVGKPVDAVRAAADVDPDYRKSVEMFNQAKYEQGLLQAAYDAIQTKKTALENLVRLHGQQYFASPREPKELGERVEMVNKTTELQSKRSNTMAKEAAASKRSRTT